MVPEKGTKYDMRRWYLGTLAMFQVGGPAWKTWNAGMKFAVIDSQRKDGDKRGSWDPDGVRGKQGGRVYATATMAMCLQAYYRYSRVFGVRKR